MEIFHSVASLHSSYGGPAFSVPRLAQAMAEEGHAVTVWAPRGAEDPEAFARCFPNVVNLGGWEQKRALERAKRADFMIDHGIWLRHNHDLARFAHEKGIPRAVSVRGMLDPWALHHKRTKKRIAWMVYQKRDLERAAFLHATSDHERSQLEELGLGRPILTAPNGVDLPDLSDSPRTRPFPDGRALHFLFVGRIHPVKGLPMFAQAWADAAPETWTFTVAGPDEGGHLAELQHTLKSLGIADRWNFPGPVGGEEKTKLFRSADVFVLPSHMESFGLAAGEALAHEIPVIATHRTPWTALDERESGWCVDATSAALAHALRQIAETPLSRLQDMGIKGRQWIAEHFSWETASRRFLASMNREPANRPIVLSRTVPPHLVESS